MTSATTPVSVPGVAIDASSSVNRSSPLVFSSSATSTLTPHTITMGVHGILRIACSWSASRSTASATAPVNAAMPMLALEEQHRDQHAGDDAKGERVRAT